MKKLLITTKSIEETKELGKSLVSKLSSGSIVFLKGDLGAGKTTMVKGFATGLQIKPEDVTSPTFVFLNIYEGDLPIYHFDLYRVEKSDELHALGYEEFVYGDGIALIEWPQRMQDLTPEEYLQIEIKHQTESTRAIEVSAKGNRYQRIIEDLA